MKKQPTGGSESDDYDLKVDEQVKDFLGLRHQLTYFLITASVGSLGFTLNSAIGKDVEPALTPLTYAVLIVASVAGLIAAASALLSLHYSNRSFQTHLRFRYERKSFEELSDGAQQTWDRTNRKAKRFTDLAFVALFASVLFQTAFFIIHFRPGERGAMHHYGEDSTEIHSLVAAHQFVFTNKETKVKIVMLVPRAGVREDGRDLSDNDAADLAMEIAHLLRSKL